MNADLLNLPDVQVTIRNAVVVGDEVPYERYHEQPRGVKRGNPAYVMSRGELAEFSGCPLKWIKAAPAALGDDEEGGDDEAKKKESAALRMGSAVDCLFFTPQFAEARIAPVPKEYTNKKGEVKPWHGGADVCKAWKLENSDKIILNQKEQAKVAGMYSGLNIERSKNSALQDAMIRGRKQVMLTAEIKASTLWVPVRCLLDLVPPDDGAWSGYLLDLKCTNDASQRAWRRHCFDFALHLQGALYLDVWKAATQQDRHTFYHLLVESEHPFIVGHRYFSANFIKLGRMHYMDALNRYAKCLETNTWPDYESEPGKATCIEPDGFMIQ